MERLACSCGMVVGVVRAWPVHCSCGLTHADASTMRPAPDRPERIPPQPPAYCPHRGAIMGELSAGCCGRPAVLACAIHGRCTRAAVRVAGPITLRLLDGTTETLTDGMPAVCRGCADAAR
jgi:hypothetical protein